MNASVVLRDFKAPDGAAVNAVALAAFEQYRDAYADWSAFSENIGRMSTLADTAELIVATTPVRLVGAVAYGGPGKPKAAFFDGAWPIVRMLVVHPEARGLGIGRALTDECISRARRDGASMIALHTTPIMAVALAMYERMGFEFTAAAPAIHGVPYRIYLKRLSD
jgi:ribosomal protein S18 acetylase RimI-like enzyme